LYEACCRLVASPLITTGPSGLANRADQKSKWGDVADREPIFNVPAGVVATLAVLIAVHVMLSLMTEDQYTWWVLALAFIPARYSGLAAQLPGGEPALVTSFVTHMAVHAELIHLAFNSLWLLAFGSVLCARIGSLRFLAFSITGGIAGALLFLALNPGLAAPVIGASGAIAAMMGGVMRFLFNAIDRRQGYLLRQNPAAIPRVSLGSAVKDPRIVFFSIVFIALNLLTMLGFGKFGASGTIAWQVHVGGYLFGLLTFAAFDTALQNGSPHSLEVD
jgi:membrane associated rhomboid family serine protease